MKEFIFLTDEGFTFQPDIGNGMTEIENLQVVGFAKGVNSEDAFLKLLSENLYLKETSFTKIFCYQLGQEYEQTRRDYNLHGH
jgi:hypothetical protein